MFFSHLIPVDEVLHQVQAFRRDYFQVHPVVGVHIRHGNGGDIIHYGKYWCDPQQALKGCEGKIQEALRQLGPSAVIFLSTDSVEVEQFIVGRFPDVIVQKKTLRMAGEGERHYGGLGIQVGKDALIDMLLLSYSSVLIRFPPNSLFSFYAQLFQGVPKPHLEIS